MPMHDWTRVEAGIFHDFHQTWLTYLKAELNGGVLPPGYFAASDMVMRPTVPDVMTLRTPTRGSTPETGTTAVADLPATRTRRTLTRLRPQRRLSVRRVHGGEVVAVIELVSPSNKDRAAHVTQFAGKIADAIEEGVHALVIDVFPPTRHDPQTLHGAIESMLDGRFVGAAEPFQMPEGETRCFASYRAGEELDAFLEYPRVGADLPAMPLFLTAEHFVSLPLERPYCRSWEDFAPFFRAQLEAGG